MAYNADTSGGLMTGEYVCPVGEKVWYNTDPHKLN